MTTLDEAFNYIDSEEFKELIEETNKWYPTAGVEFKDPLQKVGAAAICILDQGQKTRKDKALEAMALIAKTGAYLMWRAKEAGYGQGYNAGYDDAKNGIDEERA